METSNIEEQIDSKYLIREIIGSGYSADVFLVLEKKTQRELVAKVFNEKNKSLCDQELKVIDILKKENNPYIVKIINSGEGDVVRKNKQTMNTKYYIMEYASFGNIYDYIYYGQNGLGELYSKILFSKIMEGVKVCHAHNICHRDLKLENILLDTNFCPKICDFGFACINAPNLTDRLGTSAYEPPEIRLGKNYDGKKADIFCLGAALMILIVGLPGFMRAKLNDTYYQKIFRKDIKLYWKIVELQIKAKGIILSKEFKDLYIKMITYNPDSRPTAEEVLNHPWFNEINELKKDEKKMEKIENKIKQKFIDLEQTVKQNFKKEMEAKNKKPEDNNNKTKSGGYDEDIYFNINCKPKFIDTHMNMKNCINIKNLFNPNIFMNSLCNRLIKEFGADNCDIEADKKELEFNVTFEEENGEEIPEEIKEELKNLGIEDEIKKDEENNNELKIQIMLYQWSDEYILRFVLKEGDRKEFLDKFESISKLVEKIIN